MELVAWMVYDTDRFGLFLLCVRLGRDERKEERYTLHSDVGESQPIVFKEAHSSSAAFELLYQ